MALPSENGQCALPPRPRLGPMQLSMPSHDQCEQARLARDARFDGLFFTAVRSTGI